MLSEDVVTVAYAIRTEYLYYLNYQHADLNEQQIEQALSTLRLVTLQISHKLRDAGNHTYADEDEFYDTAIIK